MKKLIVGIGNTGEKYAYNRHNVGFMALDALASRIYNLQFTIYKQTQNSKLKIKRKLDSGVLELDKTILARPTTFMNNSGVAVKKLINHFSLNTNHLYVVHDDLDLPFGTWKMQYQKGPKIHRGLLSIEQQIGTKNFWRIRIGVDNRKPEFSDGVYPEQSRGAQGKIPGEKYVLEDFDRGERELLDKVIKEIVEELSSKIIN